MENENDKFFEEIRKEPENQVPGIKPKEEKPLKTTLTKKGERLQKAAADVIKEEKLTHTSNLISKPQRPHWEDKK